MTVVTTACLSFAWASPYLTVVTTACLSFIITGVLLGTDGGTFFYDS